MIEFLRAIVIELKALAFRSAALSTDDLRGGSNHFSGRADLFPCHAFDSDDSAISLAAPFTESLATRCSQLCSSDHARHSLFKIAFSRQTFSLHTLFLATFCKKVTLKSGCVYLIHA